MMFYDFSIQHQSVAGAGGDLQQVERMARAMVTQFGMSDVGPAAQLVTGNLELKTLGTGRKIRWFMVVDDVYIVVFMMMVDNGYIMFYDG
jgi:hypothetical protein